MNTRDKSSVLTRGKRMIIYCFRALVLSSMFWSVAPFLSTAQTCNVWEIEFSPAGSGSLSSCRQVSLAEREDVLPGIMNSQYFTPDIIMNVFYYPAECESLIRKILVLDPGRRLSLQQIKSHPWMQAEVNLTQWAAAWRLQNLISTCQFYQ